MCCSNRSKALSRLGLLWGLLSLGTLLTAFLSNAWLYTREPIRLPNARVSTTVTFRIGLWRVCPSFRRTNSSHYVPSPPCTFLRYSSWEDINFSELGLPSSVEFTPPFLSRMRLSTPFEALSVVLVFLATLFAVSGHCRNDQMTLVACGLYIIGGLTLGCGLVVFASVLSDAYFERPRRQNLLTDILEKSNFSSFDYKYGWSYFAAASAFVMSELAAVLTVSAYLRRFPTVEDMVRAMVPGAERRLRERQGEYLVQQQQKYQRHISDGASSLSSGLNTRCFSKAESLIANEGPEAVEGPLLLNKVAPDICSSNPPTEDAIDFSKDILIDEKAYSSNMAGQTVPIVLMHHPKIDEKRRGFKTLPAKRNIATLDSNLFADQLHKKFDDRLTLHQRFGSALTQLDEDASSSSGRKKTVTIGGVFSTMDTFEGDEMFGGASAV